MPHLVGASFLLSETFERRRRVIWFSTHHLSITSSVHVHVRSAQSSSHGLFEEKGGALGRLLISALLHTCGWRKKCRVQQGKVRRRCQWFTNKNSSEFIMCSFRWAWKSYSSLGLLADYAICNTTGYIRPWNNQLRQENFICALNSSAYKVLTDDNSDPWRTQPMIVLGLNFTCKDAVQVSKSFLCECTNSIRPIRV